MREISTRLAVAFLIIVTLSTIITAVAYFHIEHLMNTSSTDYEISPQGKLSLKINQQKEPKIGEGTGIMAIEIKKEDSI
jgi:hypothetical protein